MINDIKRIIAKSCVYFTVIVFAVLLAAEYEIGKAVFFSLKLGAITYFTVLLMSAYDLLFKIPKLSSVFLRAIHFVLWVITAMLPIWTGPVKASPAVTIVFMTVVAILYIVIAILTYVFGLIFSKGKKAEEYKSIMD